MTTYADSGIENGDLKKAYDTKDADVKPWWYVFTPDSFTQDKDHKELKKVLTSRHIQMIAVGSAIGSGLFVGSGFSLVQGGPGNMIAAFITVGLLVYFTMQAEAELCVLYPIKGSFSAFSTKFIHPAWGYAMACNYTMTWWGTLPLEISAAAITIQYWSPNINLLGFVSLFLFSLVFLNLFGVRGYGESEVFFSFIKATAVIIFIIVSIVINLGGSPSGQYLGTATWRDPGAIYNGFAGYCACFGNAAFAFSGTEMFGLAANETENPRKIIPLACEQTTFRIVFFYVVALLCMSFIVPYTDPRLLSGPTSVDTSPFVIACEIGGLSGFGDFMNFIILVSTFSVANVSTYGASRTMLALVENEQIWPIFGYIDKAGRPLVGLSIALAFGTIAYVDSNQNMAKTTFLWLLAISGLSAIFTWGSICFAHIRFRHAWHLQGRSVEEIPHHAAWGVYGSYCGLTLTMCCLAAILYISLIPVFPYGVTDDVYLNNHQDYCEYCFWSNYLAAVVIVFLFLFWLIWRRISDPEKGWHSIDLSAMNLDEGRRELPPLDQLKAERDEEANKPLIKRLLRWFI